MEIPVLETARVSVRTPVERDGEAIFNAYAQDEDVTRYLSWRTHRDVSESKKWVQYCLESQSPDANLRYVIEEKYSRSAIGMIDFKITGHLVQFGYVLSKKYWNAGIMTEALLPVFNLIFSRPETFRMQAFHDIENLASGRVMEKLGMTYEGTLKRYFVFPNRSAEPRDVMLYAKTK